MGQIHRTWEFLILLSRIPNRREERQHTYRTIPILRVGYGLFRVLFSLEEFRAGIPARYYFLSPAHCLGIPCPSFPVIAKEDIGCPHVAVLSSRAFFGTRRRWFFPALSPAVCRAFFAPLPPLLTVFVPQRLRGGVPSRSDRSSLGEGNSSVLLFRGCIPCLSGFYKVHRDPTELGAGVLGEGCSAVVLIRAKGQLPAKPAISSQHRSSCVPVSQRTKRVSDQD